METSNKKATPERVFHVKNDHEARVYMEDISYRQPLQEVDCHGPTCQLAALNLSLLKNPPPPSVTPEKTQIQFPIFSSESKHGSIEKPKTPQLKKLEQTPQIPTAEFTIKTSGQKASYPLGESPKWSPTFGGNSAF